MLASVVQCPTGGAKKNKSPIGGLFFFLFSIRIDLSIPYTSHSGERSEQDLRLAQRLCELSGPEPTIFSNFLRIRLDEVTVVFG